VRPGGIWGTPAVTDDTVYVATNGGRVLGVDRTSGAVLWEKRVPGPAWGSPVVVDDVLLLGDCAGVFHAWDVSDSRADPPELWAVELGGCIEATPAVWEGRIYIGSRNGHLYVLG
jgi:outer membrane protein assembly factor BamB